mgnify:CR=1 FL=1
MRTLRIAVITLALVVGACASSSSTASEDPPTYIVVDNRSRFDMTIYVVRDNGQRIRIGRAPSVSEERLRIPSDLLFGLTSLRFLADPLAGNRQPISNEIVIQPGEEITLTIPPM